MNYEKMSDFDLNVSVFETLHGGAPDFKEGRNSAMVLISFEHEVQLGEVVEIEVESGSFNPCKSWADAGPIIQENGIVVACYQRMEPQAWPAIEGTISASHSRNKNPLRAAMECFLKMKEAEHVYA